jgi:hypothetical protein
VALDRRRQIEVRHEQEVRNTPTQRCPNRAERRQRNAYLVCSCRPQAGLHEGQLCGISLQHFALQKAALEHVKRRGRRHHGRASGEWDILLAQLRTLAISQLTPSLSTCTLDSSSESDRLPMPRPSPRNKIWLEINPWFVAEVVPALQGRIAELLSI